MPTRTTDVPFPGSPARRKVARRNVLYAGLAVGLAHPALTGCGEDDRARTAARASGLRERAARDTARLIAAYDATAKAHPDLAGELRPLRAELTRHLDAFGGHRLQPSPRGSAPAFESGAAPESGGTGPGVPASAKAARRVLADAEKRASDARAEDLLDAPPELARLLASVAACSAGHVLLLRS